MSEQLGGLFEPSEVEGLRSAAVVVLDSLRWDSFAAAEHPNLDRWVPRQEMRHSYASWTQPSHSCLLSGLLPYRMCPGRLASATYQADHGLWARAFGGSDRAREHLYPEFSLALMARRCGWRTVARVAMPVLNEHTTFRVGFDEYQLSPSGSSLASQVDSLSLSVPKDDPVFVFVNAPDTHYPYRMPRARLPRVSGVQGALTRYLAPGPEAVVPADEVPFTPEDLADFRRSQVEAVRYADRAVPALLELLPRPALLIVLSDHGELFGEVGCFGHGPFFHPKLFEVPLAAGVIR